MRQEKTNNLRDKTYEILRIKSEEYMNKLLDKLCLIAKEDKLVLIKLYNISKIKVKDEQDIKLAIINTSNSLDIDKIDNFFHGLTNEGFKKLFEDYLRMYKLDKYDMITFDRNGIYFNTDEIDYEYQFAYKSRVRGKKDE